MIKNRVFFEGDFINIYDKNLSSVIKSFDMSVKDESFHNLFFEYVKSHTMTADLESELEIKLIMEQNQ